MSFFLFLSYLYTSRTKLKRIKNEAKQKRAYGNDS